MDIRQLRYFLGVLEAGSLSKASGPLHVAQPALGVQIRNLERELGVDLLQRHARGVVPTKAGELLAQRAEFLLRQFSRVKQELIDFGAVPSGRVTIGLTSTVAQVVVAKFVERCRQKYPEVRLVITEARLGELVGMVVRDEVDLGLAFRSQGSGEIVSEALVDDELVLVHSERLAQEVDFRTLVERELILPSQSHLVRRVAESAAIAIGQELRIFYEVDSVTMIKELVKRGLAPTILPIAAVHEEVEDGKLFFSHINNGNFRRTLFLLRSARRPPSRSVDLIHAEVRDLIGEFADGGAVGWRRARSQLLPDDVGYGEWRSNTRTPSEQFHEVA
jgi:LysR family nitrogen assimilation transcriptional regulator